MKPTEDTPTYTWRSDCHNAPVRVVGGEEGTNHWECTECAESCNAHNTQEDTPTPDYWANHTCEMTCSHIRPEDWPKQDDRSSAKTAQVVDKQLREAIINAIDSLDWSQLEFGDAPSRNEFVEVLLPLFQKEQIQLVSELMEQAVGKAVGVPCVKLEVLEHKKQELERGE